MTMSDAEVEARIRATLVEWANEDAVDGPVDLTLIPLRSPAATRWDVRWLAAAAAVVLAVVAVVAVIRRDAADTVEMGPDPSAITEIPLGTQPGVRGLAVTDDAVWVTSVFDERLFRIDPVTNRVVATTAIPSHVEGMAPFGGALWMSRYEPNEVVRVDPETGEVGPHVPFDSQPNIVTDGSTLWVVAEYEGSSALVEIDPATGAVVDVMDLPASPGFSRYADGAVWISDLDSASVTRVDLATREATVIDVGGAPRGLAVADGTIWVGVNDDSDVAAPGELVRIDAATGEVTARTPVGRFANGVATGFGAVWVTNFEDGTLTVVDAATADVIGITPIGDRPGAVVAAHGSIWLTPHRRDALVRLDPSRPLEDAARHDTVEAVDVEAGTVVVACSGAGSPTVVLLAFDGIASHWAVTEARLTHRTRVCTIDQDRAQAPVAQSAADALDALAAAGESGPFLVVGESAEALEAMSAAMAGDDDLAGLLQVARGDDVVSRILDAVDRAR